ncbi:MAG: hypothetical protein AAF674_03935 [Pseudomonadota bacterium]
MSDRHCGFDLLLSWFEDEIKRALKIDDRTDIAHAISTGGFNLKNRLKPDSRRQFWLPEQILHFGEKYKALRRPRM